MVEADSDADDHHAHCHDCNNTTPGKVVAVAVAAVQQPADDVLHIHTHHHHHPHHPHANTPAAPHPASHHHSDNAANMDNEAAAAGYYPNAVHLALHLAPTPALSESGGVRSLDDDCALGWVYEIASVVIDVAVASGVGVSGVQDAQGGEDVSNLSDAQVEGVQTNNHYHNGKTPVASNACIAAVSQCSSNASGVVVVAVLSPALYSVY